MKRKDEVEEGGVGTTRRRIPGKVSVPLIHSIIRHSQARPLRSEYGA